MEGTVKSFSRNRGFGFITTTMGKELFVHHTDIVDEGREYLVEGQRVRFQVKTSERGPRAIKVQVIGEAPLAKERLLDWRGRRHGRPRPGELPAAAARLRGIETGEEEEEPDERNPDASVE